MKWLNCEEMRLVLIGIVAAALLGSGIVKADFTWTQKADMPTGRWTQTSAVVNGKIYVIGGYPSEGEPGERALSVVEEYDPATNTWTRKTDMPTARCDFNVSSPVVDGKIYVIGGCKTEPAWIAVSTVEVYDPITDTWTRKADMPTRRWSLGTCVVKGRIYAIGGYPSGGVNSLSVVEQYDPVTDTWTRKADLPLRVGMLSARVVGGKIYAIGGRRTLHSDPWMQEYDPATDAWTLKANMLVDTSQMGSVVLGDKIVVFGGWEWSGDHPYTAMQIYDPQADIWTRGADVPFLRAAFSAEVVSNRIYAIGGTDRPHPCPATSTVFEFGPSYDFNGDGIVTVKDVVTLTDHWGQDYSVCDISPMPLGDGIVDAKDLLALAAYLEQETAPIAYWPLDETEGFATDIVGNDLSYVLGGAVWEPAGGQVGGAIRLDGVDGCIIANPVLNPAEGPFSVFAWVQGGEPGQVIVSGTAGANWLMLDAEGKLMTEVKSPDPSGTPLLSQSVITDGRWHRVGLVWDGSSRMLYVDDAIVADDTQDSLEGSFSGLYIGCGKNMQPGTYFAGLIDDVRIYNRAVTP